MGVALKYGPKVAEMLPLIAEQKYIGALKKIEPIAKGIKALTKQLNKIVALQNMPTIFTKFMNPLLLGLKIDLAGQEKFTQTEGKIKETKEALKKMGEDEVKLTAEYATAKSKIMMKVPPNKDIKEMQKIINLPPFVPVKTGLRKSLPSALLLFLIEDKETPKTNAALAKFTVEKIKAAKKKVEDAVNKATGTTPAPTTTTPAPTTAPTTEKPKTQFGKRKRGPSASLKKLCKKNGVRLMIKRGKKRVYKSSKVLKEQCKKELKKKLKKKLKNKLKNKLKKNKKKNFGKKKIKRSSIMPQAKRSYGRRKRSRGSSALNRAKAFAKKHRKKLGAVAGAAGLYGLGRGYDRFAPDTWVRPQSPLTYKDRGQTHLNPFTGRAGLWKKTGDKNDKGEDTYIFRPYLIGGIDTGKVRRPSSVWDLIPQPQKPWKFKPAAASEYGKRRRRRRKKRSFGKKAKKPSAALRRMCKKLKVKTTLKRGKKRVYKSETMLKKQCRKAKKRKAKK